MRKKERTVEFNITASDPDNENLWDEGCITVIFTGEIKTGMCIGAMRDNLENKIKKFINGKLKDIIFSR